MRQTRTETIEVDVNRGKRTFEGVEKLDDDMIESLDQEAHSIRTLFKLIFVEAIIDTLKDELEVWLLESGYQSRLTKYVAV